MKYMRTLLLLVVAATIASWGTSAACAAPSPTASPDKGAAAAAADFVKQGRTLIKGGKNAAAIEMFSKAIAVEPNDAEAFAARGDAKANLDDSKGALADYDQAIALDPEYEYAYATRCDTRDIMNDDNGAVADCTKAIALDPTDGYAWERRGRANYYLDDLKSAEADLSKAISLRDTDGDAYADRCNTRREANNLAGARADCEQALTLTPDRPFALMSLGHLEVTAGEYAAAITELSKCLAKDSTITLCNFYRGLSYLNLDEWAKAKLDCDVYLAAVPDSADALFDRATAEKNLGDVKSAIVDAAAALKQYKVNGDLSDAKDAQSLLDSLHG
ncbi:MAG TPA: tetratricopeptide repeat protein [Candidatus Eremiobacteraceae bacterium]